MEKDSVKENEIKSEVEEIEAQTSTIENTEANIKTKDEEVKEENTNYEIQGLVKGENNDEDINKNSPMKVILANVLDQLLLVAASAVLVVVCNLILGLLGYMFAQGTGAIFLAGGIIYFVVNCIYTPAMEKSKVKSTIAKKILNIN